VALGDSIGSKWRNRAEIFEGRDDIVAFSPESGSASWNIG
jgi:nuclear transport factor 2 (NTF2) superfamily protein